MKAKGRPAVSKSASSGRFLSLRIQTKSESIDDERPNCKRRRREATRGLCCVVEVVVESAAESLAALNLSVPIGRRFRRLDQPILKSLMIAFSVVVSKIFTNSKPEVIFPEENDSVQTILLDGSHKAFRVGI